MAEPDYGVRHMASAICFRYGDATFDCVSTAGQRIRDLRKARGLTQPDLGSRVGVDQSTISDIERGSKLSADVLIRIADVLEVPADFIMRGVSSSWPFAKIEISRFLVLSTEDRAYVAGRLEAAIESVEAVKSGVLGHSHTSSSVAVTTESPRGARSRVKGMGVDLWGSDVNKAGGKQPGRVQKPGRG